METIVNLLQKNLILNHSTITKNTNFIFNKENNKSNATSNQSFQINCSPLALDQHIQKTQLQIQSYGLDAEITKLKNQGSKVNNYHGLYKVFSQEQVQLIHQPGEVLLIDVWATWCGPCQMPMKHNQQMLQKNEEKWKGKARIVAVSVDQSREVIQNRVNSKGWNKIEHLTLLGWDGNHPLIKDFEIQGIPFVFLVDKEGKINYTGHPSQINLQNRINELIDKKPEQQAEVKLKQNLSVQGLISQIEKSNVFSKILKKDFLNEKFEKAQLFSIYVEGNLIISQGLIQKNSTTIKVSTDENTFIEQFKSLLKDIDPKLYKIEQNVIKFQKLPDCTNTQCADCKAKLSYPFYWCKWDPNPCSLRCRQCVEKKSVKQGHHYNYEQNSILVTGPWNRIAVQMMGNNIQPKDISKVEQPNSFGCNNCGVCPSTIGEARYVCLVCNFNPNEKNDYFDLCVECVDKLLKGDPQVIEGLKGDGHDSNHPLLRVLYGVEGYYSF